MEKPTKPFEKPFVSKEHLDKCVDLEEAKQYTKKKIKFKY
jgi:hypothetical protein